MRILNLIQKPQLRGAEIFACQLSDHLINKGNDVLVVSIFEGDSKMPFTGKLIHLNRPLSKRFVDFKGWKEFKKIVEDFRPEVIQSNAADTLKFAVSSKFLFRWNVPIVFRNANKMGDFINSRIKWELNNFYLSKVDYVISVSKECENDFIRTFNYPTHKISTVEIGVEDKTINKAPEDLKKVFQEGPVITHIGGFVPEKNHEGVIRIFNSILPEFPSAQLLLIGKGRLEESIKNNVKEKKLGDKVHFLGYRTDVLEILYHSDAFILPSKIEGLPGVILEAMFCDTAVIAYNVGGVGEVVRNSDTGWLLASGDESGFVEKLKMVLQGDDDVERKINNAKKMIHSSFLNSKISERFLKCYSKVIAN